MSLPCGPTVINHPIPIKQESTQETLPAVFLMEKQCAPLSPSSNKQSLGSSMSSVCHSLSLPQAQFLSLSVSLGSLVRVAGQATASHRCWIIGIFPCSSPEATIHSFMRGPRDHVAMGRWTASSIKGRAWVCNTHLKSRGGSSSVYRILRLASAYFIKQRNVQTTAVAKFEESVRASIKIKVIVPSCGFWGHYS